MDEIIQPDDAIEIWATVFLKKCMLAGGGDQLGTNNQPLRETICRMPLSVYGCGGRIALTIMRRALF